MTSKSHFDMAVLVAMSTLITSIGVAYGEDAVQQALSICSLIAVPTELRKEISTTYDAVFREALCGQWYDSHKEAVDTSGGIQTLKVGFSANYSTKRRDVTRVEFCRDSRYKITTTDSNKFFLRFMDEKVAQRVSECIQRVIQTRSLSISSANHSTGALSIAVRNLLPDADLHLVDVYAVGVKCKPLGRIKIPRSEGGLPITCEWKPKDDYAEVIITASASSTSQIFAVTTATRELPPVATVTLSRIETNIVPDALLKRHVSLTNSHNLHNITCDSKKCKNPGLPRDCTEDKARHCKLRITDVIPRTPMAPDAKHSTFSNCQVTCRQGNSGCSWSAPHETLRCEDKAHGFEVSAALGSYPSSMDVYVDEQTFKLKRERVIINTWKLIDKNSSFIVPALATDSSQQLVISWPVGAPGGGGDEVVPLDGAPPSRIKLVNSTVIGAEKLYTFKLNLP